ncbi:MAG: COP23 domain-containing protein [Cyanobacteria bacterium J06641_5]
MKLTQSLFAGVALAISLPQTLIAQQAPPDIIIDTDPNGGATIPVPAPQPLPTPQPGPAPPPQTTAGNARFFCQVDNGRPTVMYRPESQGGVSYPWAVPGALGGGWSPERRCQEISARLERYRPDGLLALQTTFENNYEVVCATTQNDPSCRIVFTVPPGQDSTTTLDSVFQNLVLADSGQQTTGVNTFAGGSSLGRDLDRLLGGIGGGRTRRTSSNGQINLRPFLDRNDGGTGARLQETPKASSSQGNGGSHRLNPDAFR